MVKKFEETLKKEALTWYSILHENSTDSSTEFENALSEAHLRAQKVEKEWKISLRYSREIRNNS